MRATRFARSVKVDGSRPINQGNSAVKRPTKHPEDLRATQTAVLLRNHLPGGGPGCSPSKSLGRSSQTATSSVQLLDDSVFVVGLDSWNKLDGPPTGGVCKGIIEHLQRSESPLLQGRYVSSKALGEKFYPEFSARCRLVPDALAHRRLCDWQTDRKARTHPRAIPVCCFAREPDRSLSPSAPLLQSCFRG
jgi:hypothetical protein